MKGALFPALVLLVSCTGDAVPSAEYPQFLGPDRNATLTGYGLDRDWSTHPPEEVWRRQVGEGWSAFAVSRGIAVTQEQRRQRELVVAYDLATGEQLWRHSDRTRYETALAGVGPRATPTIEGDRVVTLGSNGHLNVLDLTTGEAIWNRNVLKSNGARNLAWGKSCSPLVMNGLVVVSAGGTRDRSLVAYDLDSGELAWHGGGDRSGYASPMVAMLAGVRQILIFNKKSVAAHAPDDGRVLWRYPWSDQQPNVSQPLPIGDDRVLLSSGYTHGSKLLRIRKTAAGLEPELVWENHHLKAKFTNLVLHEGYVYGLDEGILVCLDPETGERRWKRGRYGHGQLLLVDDLLLIQAENGEVVMVEATPEEHRELGRFRPLDGRTWNHPVLAGEYLLVRNAEEAACYRLPRASSSRRGG